MTSIPERAAWALSMALASCIASAEPATPELPPQRVAAHAGDADWHPSDAQARRLVQQANDYFAARDDKRFAQAYGHFSPSQKQIVSLDAWQARELAFSAQAGPFEGRDIVKITWYRNPSGEQPGTYVATDFVDHYRDLALHCGYVAWRQRMDGSFEVVHEEANTIAKDVAAKMSPQMLQQARAAFKCQ